MTGFHFIHSSDLHLGKRFSNIPDESFRGRLQEARHAALGRLQEVARTHGAAHILLAGDIFDTETPSDPVRRQALARMGEDRGLHWWLLPGNHDSLAAEELWRQLMQEAPANVTPIVAPEALTVEDGVALLPAPCTRRYPGRDLTGWFDGGATAAGEIRIGLAHGGTVDFSEDDGQPAIDPERARKAGLDYLALGDWHGRVSLGPRTWYSGAPERTGFRHDGRGACLAVHVPGPGATPEVTPVETGQFHWAEEELPLLPGADPAEALEQMLPQGAAIRRDSLVRLRAQGRATLSQQAALAEAVRVVAPEFGYFELDTEGLATEIEDGDLDEIDRAGALRIAAERLHAAALDPAESEARRAVAEAALRRLYGYLREGRK